VTNATALAEARRRDVARRRQRVHQALAEMRAQAAEITISAVAARARVHRSFIHRHPDLRATVIAAAEDPSASGPGGTGAVSRRSLLADNANLRDRARSLEQHARSLEDRLSTCAAPCSRVLISAWMWAGAGRFARALSPVASRVGPSSSRSASASCSASGSSRASALAIAEAAASASAHCGSVRVRAATSRTVCNVSAISARVMRGI
jgi:Family of unknown function (DUF6262)